MICPSPQQRKMFLWSLWQCRLRCSALTQAHTPSVYRADIHCAEDRPWETDDALSHRNSVCLPRCGCCPRTCNAPVCWEGRTGQVAVTETKCQTTQKLPIGGSVNLCCQKVVSLIVFISHNLKSVPEYFVVSFLMKIIWRHLTLAVHSEFWWT